MGLFGRNKDKMQNGLKKTRTGFWGNIFNTLTGAEITDDLYDDLEADPGRCGRRHGPASGGAAPP